MCVICIVFLSSVRLLSVQKKWEPHGNGHFVAAIKCTNLEAFFAAYVHFLYPFKMLTNTICMDSLRP